MLRRRGIMTAMGLLGPYKTVINNFHLAFRGLSLTGSMIGSVGDTQEVVDFFAKHNLTLVIETIKFRGWMLIGRSRD